MYPDLSYFLHDLFGTERDNIFSIIQTFGLLLALAFLGSAYVLYLELKRREKIGQLKATTVVREIGKPASTGELLTNGLIGFLLGYKLVYAWQNWDQFVHDAASVILSPSGNAGAGLIAGIAFAVYAYWQGQKRKLPKPKKVSETIHPHQRVGEITIVAAISGIVGAKVFAIFESADTLRAFLSDPINTFFSGSGLAVYGGLIVAFAVVYYYVKKLGLKPIFMMDAVAPALMIGYAIGRLGCHFSGDGDWGIVNEMAKPGWFILPDWMWAYDYPHNVLNQGIPIEGCEDRYCRRLDPPVFPTPIWESLICAGLFAILWYLRKKLSTPGMLFAIYLVMNGIERFFIEKIRVNETFILMGVEMTQAELISALTVLLGLFWGGYLYKKHGKF
ncbi:MAG: hypothetical protein EA409_09855 [Saprospirales bacterium]|nr:MAG: hypothetical protein EA409_09855 [Saprospirales bacterium]